MATLRRPLVRYRDDVRYRDEKSSPQVGRPPFDDCCDPPHEFVHHGHDGDLFVLSLSDDAGVELFGFVVAPQRADGAHVERGAQALVAGRESAAGGVAVPARTSERSKAPRKPG